MKTIEQVVNKCMSCALHAEFFAAAWYPEAYHALGEGIARELSLEDERDAARREAKAMKRAALTSLHLAHDGQDHCRVCGMGNGEHGPDCPMVPVIDIVLIPRDFKLHGKQYRG